jgi:outer membrane protein
MSILTTTTAVAAAVALLGGPAAAQTRTGLWQQAATPSQAPSAATGQPAPPAQAPRRLSLEDALRLAEGGSEQVAIAEAGVRRADDQVVLARSERYPQLNSGFGYQRTLQTQFDGIFDAPAGEPCPGLIVDPAKPLQDRVAELERYLQCPPSFSFGGDASELPFGQLNTWTLSLQFSQLLWNGRRVQAQERQARAGRTAAALGVTTTRAQLQLDVATAFFDAAFSDRLVAITQATLDQATATLKQIEAQYEVGNLPEFEVLRARVSRDSQRATLIGVEAQRELAYLRLKQLLDLPADTPIELDVDLSDPSGPPAERWAAVLATAEAGYQPVERVAVEQAAAAVEASEAAVAVARAQRKPTVSLTSGFVAYAYDKVPAFDRRDWTVAGAVSFPILDGGRLKANERLARTALDESQAQRQLAAELAELDARSAHATYRAARATFEAAGSTLQQAQRAFEIAEVRYREGLSTQLELNDARLALEAAATDRARAARDMQVARVRLALLPELPLSGGAGAGAVTPGAGMTTPGAPAPSQPSAAPSGTGAPGGTGTPGMGTQPGMTGAGR